MKDKELMKGFGWSLAVHSTLLYLLFVSETPLPGGNAGIPGAEQQAQGTQEDRTVQVEIIDPPKKSDEEAQKKAEEDGLLIAAPHLKDECPDFFGGIGITETYANGKTYVLEVHDGYPAQRAGIRVGDIVMNTGEIRGEIGTHILVQVVRNETYMEFDIVRDKICTTPPTNQGANP